MVILPGVAALAASRGFAQTTASSSSTGSSGLSRKVIAHYSRQKSFSAIPKTAGKQAKYITFLTSLLSLSPAQQTRLSGIFAAASSSSAALKGDMKAARVDLGKSVTNNDDAGIQRGAGAVGRLAAQRHSIGARANADFFQILTSDQQAKLNQYRS